MAEIVRHGENGLPRRRTSTRPAPPSPLQSKLDRAGVRASVEDRFDAERMVDDYLALYRSVVELHRAAAIGEEAAL